MKLKGVIGLTLSGIMAVSSLSMSVSAYGEENAIDNEEAVAVEDVVVSEQAVKMVENLRSSTTDVAYAVEGGNIYFDKSTGTVTDCDGSITRAVIPSEIEGVSVTSIGNFAFDCYSSLAEVTIPSSVTKIGDCAFRGCSSLTEITIPSSITSIGNSAFCECSSLTEITIPSSVTSIGSGVFIWCNSLINIEVDSKNKNYTSKDGVLFNKDISEIIEYPGGKSGGYTIPSSVTSIGWDAFYGCSSLTEITIPSSVTSIGYGAFAGCEILKEISIPSGVTSIGGDAFGGCSSLTEITIPSGVTSIGDYTFDCCGSLTEITIPSSVTSIGDYAFESCSSLTKITIPSSVASIGYRAFDGCGNLTIYCEVNSRAEEYAIEKKIAYVVTNTNVTYAVEGGNIYFDKNSGAITKCDDGVSSVVIPSEIEGVSVTSIGHWVFKDCYELTDVSIPSSVTSISNWAFGGCNSLINIEVDGKNENYTSRDGVLFNKDITKIVACPSGKSEGYVIPSGVTSIDDRAFYGCRYLTEITIPSGVTSIGDCAFYRCSSLTEIVIPSGVTSIGDLAFYWCSGLTKITIPSSVTSITGYYAFDLCDNVTIYCEDGSYALSYAIDYGIPYVIIEKSDVVIKGDINGDGKLNRADSLMLNQYFAGWDNVVIDEDAADVNGDGKVNRADKLLLSQYFAGWDVTLG